MAANEILQQMQALQRQMETGEGLTLPNGQTITPPWQMPTEEEDKEAHKRRIGEALAQFGGALGSTPGSFLKGLGVAGPVGAQQYNQGEQDAVDERRARETEGYNAHRASQGQDLDALRTLFSSTNTLDRNAESDARNQRDYNNRTERQNLEDERYDAGTLAAGEQETYDRGIKSEEMILDAVKDYRDSLYPSSEYFVDPEDRKAREAAIREYEGNLRTRYGTDGGAQSPPDSEALPQPVVGESRDGYTFVNRDGDMDPYNPNNWEENNEAVGANISGDNFP